MTIDVANECPPHDPEDIWKRVWTCKRCGFTGIAPETRGHEWHEYDFMDALRGDNQTQ